MAALSMAVPMEIPAKVLHQIIPYFISKCSPYVFHCMTHFQSADYAKYSHLQGPTYYAKTEVKVISLCCIKYWQLMKNIPRLELLDFSLSSFRLVLQCLWRSLSHKAGDAIFIALYCHHSNKVSCCPLKPIF